MASSEDWITGYRIVAPRWASSAFTGEGARKYGGRWNSPGRPAVYLAGSRALAALEMLVHLTTPGSRSKPYLIFEASIPRSEIREADDARAPRGVGDEWLQTSRSLILRVPSVLIPQECNYVLNPEHPAASRIRVGKPVDFHFDPRL